MWDEQNSSTLNELNPSKNATLKQSGSLPGLFTACCPVIGYLNNRSVLAYPRIYSITSAIDNRSHLSAGSGDGDSARSPDRSRLNPWGVQIEGPTPGDYSWSGPIPFKLAGAGLGLALGWETVDSMLVLDKQEAVEQLTMTQVLRL